jgi:hypothetical protein
MERYTITLTGISDLLMHADSLPGRAIVKAWQKDPENKALSVAGDDRSPAWTWMTYLYRDSGCIEIPSDNLMTMFREGGAKVPTGNRGGSFKSQSQSGILVDQSAWPLVLANGRMINYAVDLAYLAEVTDYAEHEAAAKLLGFELFAKPAKMGQAKHVRVRARFAAGWQVSGTVTVTDPAITPEVLTSILEFAGKYCGLCDWRPSSKTPGIFGRFESRIEKL